MFHKKAVRKTYDPSRQKPEIHHNLTSGERIAGFRDLETGKFEEVAQILNDKDLENFRNEYGITGPIEKKY